jgi:hypothetical protein
LIIIAVIIASTNIWSKSDIQTYCCYFFWKLFNTIINNY